MVIKRTKWKNGLHVSGEDMNFILWAFRVRIHPTFVVPMVYRKPSCTKLIISRFSLREWMMVLWPSPQEAGPESCLRIWILILPSALEQQRQISNGGGGVWESVFSVAAISHRGLWRQWETGWGELAVPDGWSLLKCRSQVILDPPHSHLETGTGWQCWDQEKHLNFNHPPFLLPSLPTKENFLKWHLKFPF